MVRISKATEYALAAVQHLALSGAPASARGLSERYHLPAGLMAKVLQRMAAAGIVASVQGAHGGYSLRVSPDELSFLQLSEAVDGPYRFAGCEADGTCESQEHCSVSATVHQMGERVTELLSHMTIGPLLDPKEVHHEHD